MTWAYSGGEGDLQTFELPSMRCVSFSHPLAFSHGSRGRIHVIYNGEGMNRTPDQIFSLYQEEAADGRIQLRRCPLRLVSSTTVLFFEHLDPKMLLA